MAQRISQSLQSFNPESPLIQDTELAGGFQLISDKAARNQISGEKRKVGMMVSFMDSGNVVIMKYAGVDISNLNWLNEANWKLMVDDNFVIAMATSMVMGGF
jgi:hypothetical protein